MNAKWGRFGAFIVAAILIVTAVILGTENTTRSWIQVVFQAAIIAVAVYATTFVVWPRRFFGRTRVSVAPEHPVDGRDEAGQVQPDEEQAEVDPGEARSRPDAPLPDERPVAVIEPRPAGSKPGSRVHIPESPTVRNPRGRPIGGHEPSRDFRWPAQR